LTNPYFVFYCQQTGTWIKRKQGKKVIN
jgi:hypothetical protein